MSNKLTHIMVHFFQSRPYKIYRDLEDLKWGCLAVESLRERNIILESINDIEKCGMFIEIYKESEDGSWNIMDKKEIIKNDIVYHVTIQPNNSTGVSAGLSGASLGASIGSIIPGVGTAIGAAIGGVIGFIGGSIYGEAQAVQEAEAQAIYDFNSNALERISELRRTQPITPKNYIKLQSKQLAVVLSNNKIGGGEPIPEIFGRMRISPNALTPFYAYEEEENENNTDYSYEGHYSLGTGPLDISDVRLSEKYTPRSFNGGSSRRGRISTYVNRVEGVIEVPDYVSQIAEEDFTTHSTPNLDTPTYDYSGLWLYYNQSRARGGLKLNMRLNTTSTSYTTPTATINGTDYNLSSRFGWLASFYDILSIHGSEALAITAIESVPFGMVYQSSQTPSGWWALKPKVASQLPIFIIETTYLSEDIGVDSLIPSTLTITNRRANSKYEVVTIDSVSSLVRSFSYFNPLHPQPITIQGSRVAGTIESFRVYRVAYADIVDGNINLFSFQSVSSQTNGGNGRNIFEIETIEFINSVENFSFVIDEVGLRFRMETTTPRRPSVPVYPEEPIFNYEFDVYSGSGDSRRVSLGYIRALERHTEDVQEYNEEVREEEEDYKEDVEDYRRYLERFNEDFNRFSKGINEITLLAERSVPDILADNSDNNIKSRNPADIFISILNTFVNTKSNLFLSISDLVEIDEFIEWKSFCNRNNLYFDGVFDFESTIFEALQQIAFVGLADVDFSFGKIRLILKTKRTLVRQHFHSRNLRKFRYQRSTLDVPDVLVADFQNNENFYKKDEVRVLSEDKTESTARTEQRVSFFGIVERQQAVKLLELQARTQANPIEVFSFETDIQGLIARRGDLVGLNHSEIHESNFVARVFEDIEDNDRKVLGIIIDQDSVPELEEGQEYSVTIKGIAEEVEADVDRIESVVPKRFSELHDKDESEITTRSGGTIAIRPQKKKAIYFKEALEHVDYVKFGNGDYVLFGIKTNKFTKCLVLGYTLDKSLNMRVTLQTYYDNNYLLV